jgi:DNA-binding transcriptional LysR family regulator
MDLHRVSIFVRVVQEGGFTSAAKALSLPKSSVSRAVALLEQEIGARLLRRSTRSIALTEAGTAFFERATQGLAALEEAREAVVSLETEMRGRIRITAPPDAGSWMLSPLIAVFVERHPLVLVEAVLTSRVVELAEEGFDLALRAGPLHDESLVARALPRLDFGIYASAEYLAQHGTPRTVDQLASHRCVLFRAPRGHATWALTGPRGTDTVEVRGPIATDDFTFALESVARGAGIGLLPRFLAERCGGPRVERVLPRYTAPGAGVNIVYPAGRYVPRRVAALRDFLVSELAPATPVARAKPTRSRA